MNPERKIKPGDLVKLKDGCTSTLYRYSDSVKDFAENIAGDLEAANLFKQTKTEYKPDSPPIMFLREMKFGLRSPINVFCFLHENKVWAALFMHDTDFENFYYVVRKASGN